jgi:hypothetical protein
MSFGTTAAFAVPRAGQLALKLRQPAQYYQNGPPPKMTSHQINQAFQRRMVDSYIEFPRQRLADILEDMF